VEQATDNIDLRYYVSVLQKWRLVIALVTIVSVLTAAFLSLFVLPPVYETKVTLMVSSAGMQRMAQYQPDDLRSMVGIMSRLPEMTVNTYVGQLTSAYFLDRIVKQMGLDPVLYTQPVMAKLVEAKAIKDTNLVEIKVSNNNPKLATAIANRISTEFIDFITENLQDQMTKSIVFLEEQAAQTNRELVAANDRLRQVQVGLKGVESLDRELKSKSQALSDHTSALLRAKVEEQSLAAGLDRLTQELAAVPRYLRAEGGGQAGEPNPAYRQIEQQIKDKRVALAEKTGLRAGYEGSIAELSAEIALLQNAVGEKRTEEYRLSKQVAQLEQTYSLLREKIVQTQMTRSMNIGEANISIVAPAVQPVLPVRPRKALNCAVAGALGLVASMGLAFALEYIDYTVKSAEDVATHLGVPLLGSVPVIIADRRQHGGGE
jgi:capsular polysaccharide biosynthesis protein